MYDRNAFVERVIFALQQGSPITWIVGSPLAYDVDSKEGVPGVNGVVDLIRQEFEPGSDNARLLADALADASANPYQSAFKFLAGYKGQKQANGVIRKAVLQAYSQPSVCDVSSDDALRLAERDTGGWYLPGGVRALGDIVQAASAEGRAHVLTTNFDPLIEISIRKAGGTPITTFFHRDGSPHTVHTEQPHVVHLHGYWIGSDTLHTPHQLRQERPQLRAALAGFLRSSVVVVLGYSGWDDVITQAIADVVEEDASFPEVIWAFFDDQRDVIERDYGHVLQLLNAGLARNRVAAYVGVDCHSVLPEIASRMRSVPLVAAEEAESAAIIAAPPIWKKVVASSTQFRATDAIPTLDKFVGRRHELQALHQATAKVIAISGLGGQGKSILAAQFIDEFGRRQASGSGETIIDWRDCKEEGNTAHLSLCLFLERITKGEILAQAVATAAPAELAALFCERVRDLHGVLVLDNIDTYVDVENSEPLGTIRAVVDRHMGSQGDFKILLTSRPQIKLPHSSFFALHIAGLNGDAIRDLYQHKTGGAIADSDLERLLSLTEGHALGTVLLAAQKLSSSKPLASILDELASSRSDIGKQILRGTYRLLKQEDQEVLRSLAELERPESEMELEEITGLRFNKLRKAMRRLRDMNLIMDRVDTTGHVLVDLHPLVRQFIRHEFPRKDRESFIGRVLGFFDRRLLPLRKQIEMAGVPASALQLWLHKVEILINRASWADAVDELCLISGQLERQGFTEEQIRLGEKILLGADWSGLLRESKGFRKFVGGLLGAMTYFGQHERVDHWLGHYESQVTRGGADAIVIGSSRAFDAWFRKDYEQAIAFAQEAKERHISIDVSVDSSPAHTYALALRDSGKLDLALPEFLEGLSLEAALEGKETKGGQYYGNVGRCLQLAGQTDKALKAYRLCFDRFEDRDSTGTNAGWLRHWVGECLTAKKKRNDAFACHVAARSLWSKSSPVLKEVAQTALHDLTDREKGLHEDFFPEWKAERIFRQWGKSTT